MRGGQYKYPMEKLASVGDVNRTLPINAQRIRSGHALAAGL